jgi:hypothetical protein
MKFLKKLLLMHRTRSVSLFLCLIILFACEPEQEMPENYAARVGKDFLYEEDIEFGLSNARFDSISRNQFIRKWIRERVLFNLAIEKRIDERDSFKQRIDEIKKDILISSLLTEVIEESIDDLDEGNLKEFYNSNSYLFRTKNKTYHIREIKLDSKKDILNFLNAESSTIENMIEIFNSNYDKNISFNNVLIDQFSTYPNEYLQKVKSMKIGQLSEIVNPEQNLFTVVQLVGTLEPGTLPDFSFIKEDLIDIYSASKKKEIINKFVANSLNKFDIEIKGTN